MSTLFSWGYWGWGNATSQFVAAVDEVERRRGFQPPLFVDVRYVRQVRAKGFSGAAFEHVVGSDRYRWMRELGNSAVATRTGPAIQIANPTAADALLDRALEAEQHRRRVIFFCSCKHPVDPHAGECHRVTVARLVREAARLRGLDLRLVEWPGGETQTLDFAVSSAELREVHKGRKSLRLIEAAELSALAGLPWGSLLRLRASDATLAVVSGPAQFHAGKWCLPVFRVFEGDDDTRPQAWAREFRRAHGYEGAAD